MEAEINSDDKQEEVTTEGTMAQLTLRAGISRMEESSGIDDFKNV